MRGAQSAATNVSRIESLPPTRGEIKGGGKLSPEIAVPDLRTDVEYLASDALEGRMTGSKGAQLASDYIADRLREAGLKPVSADGSYFQEF